MQEIVQTLERNIREVRYGSVSVELRVHGGKVVRAIYTTSTSMVERVPQEEMEDTND